MASPLVLRVILAKDNAEKVILPSRPETVHELKLELKSRLHLTGDFRLQFKDPDFNLALINLVNMSDLPSRATITLTNLEESPNNRTEESAVPSVSSPARTYTRSDTWVVPNDVEYILNEGNVAFARDGRTMKPTTVDLRSTTFWSVLLPKCTDMKPIQVVSRLQRLPSH